MTYREILRRAGMSLTQLARKAGVSRQLATDTVDGVKANRKVLRELEALKKEAGRDQG